MTYFKTVVVAVAVAIGGISLFYLQTHAPEGGSPTPSAPITSIFNPDLTVKGGQLTHAGGSQQVLDDFLSQVAGK